MSKSHDEVLDRAKVREVTGVFHSMAALDAAANALLLAGFDRADIDRVASFDEVLNRVGAVYVAPEELADVGRAPRQPFIAREDISTTVIVAASVLGSAAALAAVFAVVASGGGWAPAIAAAVVAAGVVGGVGTLLIARYLRRERSRGLEPHMAARGLILWVRVRSGESEDKAQEILLAHGAKAVRVHEIEIEKRPEDPPLSSLRPDPWLGDERLGQP